MLSKAIRSGTNQLFRARFNSTISSPIVTKPKPIRKFLLYSVVLTNGSFILYYQFGLNAQEKRKVRVNLESVGRAVRSLQAGLKIITDYKWNLWNLDDVITQ